MDNFNGCSFIWFKFNFLYNESNMLLHVQDLLYYEVEG